MTTLPNTTGANLVRVWLHDYEWQREVLPVLGFIVEDAEEPPACLLPGGKEDIEDALAHHDGDPAMAVCSTALLTANGEVFDCHGQAFASIESYQVALHARWMQRRIKEGRRRCRLAA